MKVTVEVDTEIDVIDPAHMLKVEDYRNALETLYQKFRSWDKYGTDTKGSITIEASEVRDFFNLTMSDYGIEL